MLPQKLSNLCWLLCKVWKLLFIVMCVQSRKWIFWIRTIKLQTHPLSCALKYELKISISKTKRNFESKIFMFFIYMYWYLYSKMTCQIKMIQCKIHIIWLGVWFFSLVIKCCMTNHKPQTKVLTKKCIGFPAFHWQL